MAGTTLSISGLNTHLKCLGIDEPIPELDSSKTISSIIDLYKCYIAKYFSHLSGLSPDIIFASLDRTLGLDKGDLVLAIPRLRINKAKPLELGTEWATQYGRTILPQLAIPYILDRGTDYGCNTSNGLLAGRDKRKKIVIEFSSPNIAKPFHAGHLRSTIIGGFLCNLYERAGWDVTSLNYFGDWGRQYGMLAIGWERYGSEEALATDPMRHLVEIYVKIFAEFEPAEKAIKEAAERGEDATEMELTGIVGQVRSYFKKMEDGDPEALALWSRFRSISIERYKETYARLNIHFDEYTGESKVKQESMSRVEKMLAEKGITESNQGATIIDFKKHGAPHLAVAIIRNRNGTTNYLLRDLGAAIERWEQYQFDKMIYVVMSEQEAHLQRLFKILQLLGYNDLAQRVQHISYGKVKGMSTRRGNVKYLDDLFEECGTFMHDVMKKNELKYAQLEDPETTSDTLGITAVMVQDMSGKRVNGYTFDLARMTAFEGDTGPYLQYAHARLCSIARKSGLSQEQLRAADLSLLKEEHATDIIRVLVQYPDIYNAALKALEPSTIVTYLFKLTHQLSSGYDSLRVFNAPEGPEVAAARAALFEAGRVVVRNGLELLGLVPLERM